MLLRPRILWSLTPRVTGISMHHHRGEGIILRRRSLFEADRAYTVYTRDFGKIELLARGSAKIVSKLSAHMEPGTHATVQFITGRKNTLLTGALAHEHYMHREGLDTFGRCGAYCELVDAVVTGSVADERIFDLLLMTLRLTRQGGDTGRRLFPFFVIKLFSYLGYKPARFAGQELIEYIDSLDFGALQYTQIEAFETSSEARDILLETVRELLQSHCTRPLLSLALCNYREEYAHIHTVAS